MRSTAVAILRSKRQLLEEDKHLLVMETTLKAKSPSTLKAWIRTIKLAQKNIRLQVVQKYVRQHMNEAK